MPTQPGRHQAELGARLEELGRERALLENALRGIEEQNGRMGSSVGKLRGILTTIHAQVRPLVLRESRPSGTDAPFRNASVEETVP